MERETATIAEQPTTEQPTEQSESTAPAATIPDGFVSLTPDNGVLKKILREGSGDMPTKGSKVVVHYVGTFLDGRKFDSSRDRNDFFKFDLGAGAVIKGWDIGVATMKLGELCILTCASEYAYGKGGSGSIPPNSTLNFEVELFDFTDGKNEWDMTLEEKIEVADKARTAGNELFRAGKIEIAILKYQRCVNFFAHFASNADEALKAKAMELKSVINLNIALCFIRSKQYKDAVDHAKTVTEIDSSNPKGWYRLGCAYRLMQDYSNAHKALQKALELAPTDKAIQDEATLAKKDEAAAAQKEKKLFATMMKGALST